MRLRGSLRRGKAGGSTKIRCAVGCGLAPLAPIDTAICFVLFALSLDQTICFVTALSKVALRLIASQLFNARVGVVLRLSCRQYPQRMLELIMTVASSVAVAVPYMSC